MCNITCNCFLHHYLVDPDIAFNKQTYASSAYDDNWDKYGPQLVNNGKADCSHPSGPIAHTKKDQTNEWFKIDLQGTFNIKTVAVLPRKSKFLY